MQTLQEYKCPCCGGAIAFDSTLQKMKCPYCDTEFEMEALEGYDAELQSEKSDNMEWETSLPESSPAKSCTRSYSLAKPSVCAAKAGVTIQRHRISENNSVSIFFFIPSPP